MRSVCKDYVLCCKHRTANVGQKYVEDRGCKNGGERVQELGCGGGDRWKDNINPYPPNVENTVSS